MLRIFIVSLILIFPPLLMAESHCETSLTQCQNLIKEITKTVHFSKDYTQQDIINWWKSEWFHGEPLGVLSARYKLSLMQPDRTTKGSNIYLIPDNGISSITLQIPNEQPSGDYPWSCIQNKSKIGLKDDIKLTDIYLNPSCSESYGPDEVEIQLFWLNVFDPPLIEIVSNGPACIPVHLFAYDKFSESYKLAAKMCDG